MASSIYQRIRMIDIFKAAKPILLSHHPNCHKFENHVAVLNGNKICLGCIIIYPTLILTSLFLVLLEIMWLEIINWYLLPIGMILFSAKFFNIQKKPLKVIVNIFVGINGALVILGTFSLPIPIFLQLLVFVLLIFAVSYLAFYKLKKKLRVCSESCEFNKQWHLCPGLSEVYFNIRSINSFHTSDTNPNPVPNTQSSNP
jgi:hypothetical protein